MGCAARSSLLYFDETNAKREPNTLQTNDPYMTRQGGPKTLPAAFWQANGGEAVAPAEHRSGCRPPSDRRHPREQPICHRKRPKTKGKRDNSSIQCKRRYTFQGSRWVANNTQFQTAEQWNGRAAFSSAIKLESRCGRCRVSAESQRMRTRFSRRRASSARTGTKSNRATTMHPANHMSINVSAS